MSHRQLPPPEEVTAKGWHINHSASLIFIEACFHVRIYQCGEGPYLSLEATNELMQ